MTEFSAHQPGGDQTSLRIGDKVRMENEGGGWGEYVIVSTANVDGETRYVCLPLAGGYSVVAKHGI